MKWLRRGDSGLSLPLFALAHVGIFAGLFRSIYAIEYSGTGLYYTYAGKTLAGLLPYRDFVLEYPPIALLFFTLPRLLGESFRWYYVWFQAEVVLFDLVALGALYLAARWWSLPPWRVLGAYTIAILAAGPITLHQFDIFPAAFTLLAIVAFARGREGWSGAFLALGIMTKVYPVLLAPLLIIVAWHRGRRRQIVTALSAAATVALISVGPWLARAPSSLLVLLNYHTQRGLHIDSMWGTLSFAARAFGLTWVETQFAFASWQITGPAPDFFLRISTFVLLAVLIAIYAWFYRRISRTERAAAIDLHFLARASAVVILGSMAASKVLSPQYLVWPVPFLALLEPADERRALAVFVVIGVLSYWGYPLHYDAFLAKQPLPVVVFGIRNVLIAGLAWLLTRPGDARGRDRAVA